MRTESAKRIDAAPKRVGAMLDLLWQRGGTDLLLSAGMTPQLRVHGELEAVPNSTILTVLDTDELAAEVLSREDLDTFREAGELDFSFSWGDEARVRGNIFRQRGSTALALRLISRELPTMEHLGLPPVINRFAHQHQGLVLVTGPTGSGKSTTLAAIINEINTVRPCHILTIEDPIEYLHKHKRAIVNQREVGTDTASFSEALRAALREDPDVLLVGEMRDLVSIRFALTLAETGHLVFATLHTNDTSQSIARIIDVFPGDQQQQVRVQLAAALSGIVYQRLLPAAKGGMVAAYEVLVATPAVRNLIKEGKTHQLRNQLLTGHRDGMVTLEQSLSALVQSGTVTHEEAVVRSMFPKEVEADARASRVRS